MLLEFPHPRVSKVSSTSMQTSVTSRFPPQSAVTVFPSSRKRKMDTDDFIRPHFSALREALSNMAKTASEDERRLILENAELHLDSLRPWLEKAAKLTGKHVPAPSAMSDLRRGRRISICLRDDVFDKPQYTDGEIAQMYGTPLKHVRKSLGTSKPVGFRYDKDSGIVTILPRPARKKSA